MKKLLRALVVVLAITAIAIPGPATAVQTMTHTAQNHGVTQVFSLNYNAGTCSSGISKVQITSAFLKWRRSSTRRDVSVAHIFLQQGYIACDGEARPRQRHTTHNPSWGCMGRCSNMRTESVGVAVDWGFVHRDGDGNQTSGSGHGHVTNGRGEALGGLCSRISLHNGPVACE